MVYSVEGPFYEGREEGESQVKSAFLQDTGAAPENRLVSMKSTTCREADVYSQRPGRAEVRSGDSYQKDAYPEHFLSYMQTDGHRDKE